MLKVFSTADWMRKEDSTVYCSLNELLYGILRLKEYLCFCQL